jgi:hypothetical protein
MASKKTVAITFFIQDKQWFARGGRVAVEAPTLQAARRRVRKAVHKIYGPDAEFSSSLQLPEQVRDKIEVNRQKRATSRRLRLELRQHTVALLAELRDDLGASYEDASELLGVDGAGLMRLVHKTSSLNIDDD